ncbi:MAG: glycosyltransferase family 39 protein [Phycisphaerae bacterium]|nr:glycosyltransferase family 39 protein [Phycisphaerae bacterium]
MTKAAANDRRADLVAGLALSALYLGVAAIPILRGDLGQKAADHRFFHLPLIREWAATWPAVDIRDYNSATGPLYHWLLSGAAQIVGTGDGERATALQFVNALIGAAFVVIAYCMVRRVLKPATAFAGAAALALSPYLLGNGIWLMTDNLAFVFIALTVGTAAFAAPTAGWSWRQGAFAAAATVTRQINIWLAAPIAVAWLVRSRLDRASFVRTVIACAMPIAVLATFVVLWGGLVPPRFKAFHTGGGVQIGTFGYALAILAAYGLPLAIVAEDGLAKLARRPSIALGALALGVVVAALGPSSASLEAGRNGGWMWRLADLGPDLGARSLVIVAGGAVGMLVLVALYLEAEAKARANEALVLVVAFFAYVAAHAANAQVFQRYFDPIALLTILWLAGLAGSSRKRTIAFTFVALVQAGFAYLALVRSIAAQ